MRRRSVLIGRPNGTFHAFVPSYLNRVGWMNMNDVMTEVPSDSSEVSDLRGVSLAELLTEPATDAVVARVTCEESKAPDFAPGSFNSSI